ncbi:hydroxyethylthiazole kinase-like uncharacterized protein yjeF/hydroxyethylthiazole kinase-like uncharacterized protein yjeF [Antricoccus suffuscus]|uniref:ADP-dependent (S)-NAD(P)H-hydrate dehydratase n=1 Tax=Antricoccus suffuscus TaxID=1629062 RepID=A0A2T0Z353_9ACTN|nr:NAD(P)H-hydrate dehydratase [Antricoccus suffuscus]PRZ30777.1 hydroxyethylthiazole kinase-like uncharacterized protein yjeF/hydroxyethylthiazole kinase-like uncharacterized protein yjeF [Antricoccus suffuscus]
MRSVYDSTQVRAAEARLKEFTAPGELMQRAAYGLANECLNELHSRRGGVYGARAALLVGPGGNGGDALYSGVWLLRRGIAVHALLVGVKSYPGAREAFVRAGGTVGAISDADAATAVSRADLVIDGIAGLGSSRSVELPDSVAEAIATTDALVCAVDLPSGVNGDTGQAYDGAIHADMTATFGAWKPAQVLAPARRLCGDVRFVDIGLGPHLTDPRIDVLDYADIAAIWPGPSYDSHKYSTGVVGVIAGSAQYPGAAVMCVGGAIRSKPGMVRYVGAPDAIERIVAAWPAAVGATSIDDAGRTNAWVIGPGMGTDDAARSVVRSSLSLDVPVIYDADALTILSGDVDRLRERQAPTVLTPHSGEFARLFGEVGDDPVESVKAATRRTGCVVLLKGPSTIVAAPGGRVLVNETGSSKLATAGTGDVLSGIIGAALAAGLPAQIAAAAGAYVHGALADQHDGPLIAPDLIDELPAFMARLQA